MSSFSALISSEDLNDFISPSQACIKPVPTPKTESHANTKIEMEYEGYYEISADGSRKKLQQTTISLNDCLACSGCITSAESVLITMQSHKEVYQVLGIDPQQLLQAYQAGNLQPVSRPLMVVFSISPQSISSIATKYGLSAEVAFKKVTQFLRVGLGVAHVFDTAFSRELSLWETAQEFIKRYPSNGPLPLLTSACPGWICYAEKTHSDILPYISSTNSPQQMMGALVKQYLPQLVHVPSENIYHVTVMPCYDKKLEASRNDFMDQTTQKRWVDCVLTTTELDAMVWECTGKGLHEQPIMEIDPLQCVSTQSRQQARDLKSINASSGGYLLFVLAFAAHHLFHIQVTQEHLLQGTGPIRITQGRNSDYKEYHLFDPEHPEKGILLRCVAAYGFRNIQNLVRKIKGKERRMQARKPVAESVMQQDIFTTLPPRQAIDFVEIMACPSGCINGGGQLKVPGSMTNGVEGSTSTAAAREWIARVEETYQSIGSDTMQHSTFAYTMDPRIEEIYRNWLQSDPNLIQQHLHTKYHAVDKLDVNGLMVQW